MDVPSSSPARDMYLMNTALQNNGYFFDEFDGLLGAGSYFIIAEVDWTDGSKDKSFAVTCYGPGGV